MKKVLIVGGGGFVGMNLAQYLLRNRNYTITIADYSFPRDRMYYFTEEELTRVNFILDDFTISNSFKNLDKDFDYVYMLASVVGVNNTLDYPEEVIRINTSLIFNCLEWL